MGINESKKSKAITLIELLICLSIMSVIASMVVLDYNKRKEQQDFQIAKKEITQFIRKVQKYSYYNKKQYIVDVQINNKIIYFKDGNKILDKLEIPKKLSYMTNNELKNKDFIRKTTENGNFDKGFTLYLINTKGNKIYYRVSTSTTNVLKYPMISIYKAIKPIELSNDYEDDKKWMEEL